MHKVQECVGEFRSSKEAKVRYILTGTCALIGVIFVIVQLVVISYIHQQMLWIMNNPSTANGNNYGNLVLPNFVVCPPVDETYTVPVTLSVSCSLFDANNMQMLPVPQNGITQLVSNSLGTNVTLNCVNFTAGGSSAINVSPQNPIACTVNSAAVAGVMVQFYAINTAPGFQWNYWNYLMANGSYGIALTQNNINYESSSPPAWATAPFYSATVVQTGVAPSTELAFFGIIFNVDSSNTFTEFQPGGFVMAVAISGGFCLFLWGVYKVVYALLAYFLKFETAPSGGASSYEQIGG